MPTTSLAGRGGERHKQGPGKGEQRHGVPQAEWSNWRMGGREGGRVSVGFWLSTIWTNVYRELKDKYNIS